MLWLLVASAFVCASAAPTDLFYDTVLPESRLPAKCGLQNYDGRIVGGVESVHGTWPWMASMAIASGSSVSHVCGASLIDSQWLVTASHCFDSGYAVSSWRATLGDHNRGVTHGTEQRVSFSKIIKHPSYNAARTINDIALVKLATPVSYNNYVSPVCVPDTTMNFKGGNAVTTGWGYLNYNGYVSTVLREVTVPILTDTRCQQKYPTDALNMATQYCAGEENTNKDSCQGDSGGPLMAQQGGRWQLAGVVSWGRGCGNGGVYTNVAAFKSWIETTMAAN